MDAPRLGHEAGEPALLRQPPPDGEGVDRGRAEGDQPELGFSVHVQVGARGDRPLSPTDVRAILAEARQRAE